ncbi:winged helix DNA-binding domain-containing protein [Hymenobacter lucidus]|uniref:Winged helix DNA-binding domain-containing protein n=1 Tax=Hymenobacter lucidus TaxID=2880930 RepID=A0ABS8ARI6_9BACT|nr:winged helix DNA-binding domain-containing protein [Hymenobacter lucidus]MCB2408847.1 winged helix DNA-binding domain-containing protein [Hymenobacter lucidus]
MSTTTPELLSRRLANQHITSPEFTQPAQLVAWMGAMQAQEYSMAKWAVGLRVPGSTDEAVEADFNAGRILRTHLLRPTWHFVSPPDIRWLLALTAPHIIRASAYTYRQAELDEVTFGRSGEVLARALEGGRHLTREELAVALAEHNIAASGLRLSTLMMRAELDGLICSGPRRGNQFTYALLDERVPPVATLTPEAALAALTLRYYTSRGPATLADFAGWSSLTMKQVKTGVALVKPHLEQVQMQGQDYFLVPQAVAAGRPAGSATFLMPDYDEYGMAYKDRSALFHPASAVVKVIDPNSEYNRMVVLDGRIVGRWRRTVQKAAVVVDVYPAVVLTTTQVAAITEAAGRYGRFLGKPVAVRFPAS